MPCVFVTVTVTLTVTVCSFMPQSGGSSPAVAKQQRKHSAASQQCTSGILGLVTGVQSGALGRPCKGSCQCRGHLVYVGLSLKPNSSTHVLSSAKVRAVL